LLKRRSKRLKTSYHPHLTSPVEGEEIVLIRCLINFPSPGGLVRLRREGMKGRGWKKEIPK